MIWVGLKDPLALCKGILYQVRRSLEDGVVVVKKDEQRQTKGGESDKVEEIGSMSLHVRAMPDFFFASREELQPFVLGVDKVIRSKIKMSQCNALGSIP